MPTLAKYAVLCPKGLSNCVGEQTYYFDSKLGYDAFILRLDELATYYIEL